MTRADTTLLLETGDYYADFPPEQSDRTAGSGFLLGLMIWAPGIAAAAILYLAGQTVLGLGALAASMLLHILFLSRIAIYALIAAICIQQVVGFLPAVSTIAKIMGVIAGIVSLPRIVNAMNSRKNDPIVKWIAPFVLLGFMVFPLSPAPVYSLVNWITMLLVYSMPLILCVQLVRQEYFRFGLVVFVLAAFMIAVMFIRVGDSETIQGWQRAELSAIAGEADNDINEQARLMSLGVLTTIFLFFAWKGLARKAICLVTGFILCIGIVISKSRACYVSLPAAVALGFLLSRWTSLPKKVVTLTTSAILLVLVFFIGGEIGFFGAGIQKRFDSIFERGAEAGNRVTYWRAHLQTSLERTGLMGNGISGARLTRRANELGAAGHVAHNNLIDILSDLGVVGVILFVGIFVNLFRRLWKLPFRNEQLFGFMIVFFMILAAMTQRDYIRKYFGLALGLVLVLIRLSEQRAVEEGWGYGLDTELDSNDALHMEIWSNQEAIL